MAKVAILLLLALLSFCEALTQCKVAPVTLIRGGCPYKCLSANMVQDTYIVCRNDGETPVRCSITEGLGCHMGLCLKAWCNKDKSCLVGNSTKQMQFESLCQVEPPTVTDDPFYRPTTLKPGKEEEVKHEPDVMKIVITVIFVILGVVLSALLAHRSVLYLRAYMQARRSLSFEHQSVNMFRDESALPPSAPPVFSQYDNTQLSEIPTDDPPPYSEPLPPPYSEIVPGSNARQEAKISSLV